MMLLQQCGHVGYCYMIEEGANSSLLVHVTELLFCIYVPLFLASIFNSVNSLGSMSSLYKILNLQIQTFPESWEF